MQQIDIIELRRSKSYSCVIANGDNIYTFIGRGVDDLYQTLKNQPHILRGAYVADKLVGKGAASLMVLGGVRRIFTEVISTDAIKFLDQYDITVGWEEETPRIINRKGDDICPIEKACAGCETAEECLVAIEAFLKEQAKK